MNKCSLKRYLHIIHIKRKGIRTKLNPFMSHVNILLCLLFSYLCVPGPLDLFSSSGVNLPNFTDGKMPYIITQERYTFSHFNIH